MNKEQVLEIVKGSFMHLMHEENVQVCHINVLLYFPTIGIALVELDEAKKQVLDNDDIEDMNQLLLKKELEARPVYIDFSDENFHVGHVINDILMEAQFVPGDSFFENKSNT